MTAWEMATSFFHEMKHATDMRDDLVGHMTRDEIEKRARKVERSTLPQGKVDAIAYEAAIDRFLDRPKWRSRPASERKAIMAHWKGGAKKPYRESVRVLTRDLQLLVSGR